MENIAEKLTDIFEDFWISALEALPDLAIAMVVLAVFWGLSRLVRLAAGKAAQHWDIDPSIKNLITTTGSAVTIAVGLFSAAAVLFPGLSAGDLVGVLGLSSVAIGFAFKDIFQNFLAGILILSRRPFKIGDFIQTNDFEGFVEDISFRSTIMRTLEGYEIVIPNASIFTNPMEVQTARDQVRTTFTTGIGYGEDIEEAREILLETVKGVDGVINEPAPQVLLAAHDSSSINFDIRYWTSSQPGDRRLVFDRVATATKYALDKAGIDIPFPQRVLHMADRVSISQVDRDAA